MGAIVLVFVLVPEPKQPSTAATGKPGSAQVAQPTSVRVRRADRRAIDWTLDKFIPAGVARRSMATAWRLAGPELKAGSTLRQWRKDDSPIAYYPVAGNTFDDWQTIDAGRNYVEFTLSVSPRRGSRLGSWIFSVQVIRRGSRWLVNRIYPTATFSAAGAPTGPAADAGGAGNNAPSAKPKLSRGWLVGILYAIPAILAFTPALLLALFLLDRRRRRRRPLQPLPPLPTSAASAARE